MCKLRHAQCYWSLPYYFILFFIRPMCSRIFKKNVCIIVHSRNIYVDIFLIDLIFILQIIYFCTGCLSRCNEIWIQDTYFSRRPRCKRIRLLISRVTKRKQSRNSPRLILLLHQHTVRSSSMLQKYFENGVIVFCVERSFRMFVTDFCLEKRQIPHEDKILNPQLAVAPSLRHHRWLSSCLRLSRGGPPRALRRAICQYSQRHSITSPR